MDKRKTYWGLIIVAVIGMVLTLGYLIPLQGDQWYPPLAMVEQIVFILAVFCSLLLCEKATAKAMHYAFLTFLGLFFLKDIINYASTQLDLGIMLNSIQLNYIYYGLKIVLLTLLLITSSARRHFHWMYLGALLCEGVAFAFFIAINNKEFIDYFINHVATITYVMTMVGVLWPVGAIIMGVKGLIKTADKTIDWEEEEILEDQA